ncbi:glyoxalase [Azospirillum sp. B4]|uniref:glyoxalase n=1 Tax=Azospirillum sp. B4 TaxID=95605 RepID=UPI0003470E17|nr:glyoxalase [Azospirillum sp. B4]
MTRLDHATLRTADLEGTRAFLEAVLDLKPGYRPPFGFPGYWLYAEEGPIVHLIPGSGAALDRAGEVLDHVAFRLSDHAAMRARLERMAIAYSTMDLPDLGERRLFVRTPPSAGGGAILLELVFREG